MKKISDELINEYEKLKKEVNNIYELSKNNNISLYQLKKIIKTIKIIEIKNKELSDNKLQDIYILKKVTNLRNVMLFYIMAAMSLVVFHNLYILHVILISEISFGIYTTIKNIKLSREENKMYGTILKLESDINLKIANTKINVDKIVEELDKKKDNTNLDDIDLANTVILDMIYNKNIDYEIPNSIKDLAIKILQDDLNTQDSDLNLLIKEAKIKLSTDYISDRLGIKRKVLESECE